MGAYSGYLFLMPEFLQQARGASALSSGLTTFPGAIGVLDQLPDRRARSTRASGRGGWRWAACAA